MSLAKDVTEEVALARYETDVHAWTREQAGLLRKLRPAGLDWENVAEEIESLGSEQLHALESYYSLLIMHLLKWHYQPERRSRSWRSTIIDSRSQIERRERRNPSLKATASDIVADVYASGRDRAAAETDLPLWTFPSACPYSFDQLRDRDLLPE